MELRKNDLKSALARTETQEDSSKIEVETYNQQYVQECKIVKSLSNKQNK